MKAAVFIVNPTAGRSRAPRAAEAAAAVFEAAGVRTSIRATRSAGDATRLAREAAAEHDAVLAVGGDGTLTEVLAGLPAAGAPALGVVPVGTANVVAREIGLPLRDPAAAAAALLGGETMSVDFGLANGVPFIANAGAGFDAMVIHRLAARRRASGRTSGGMLSYVPLGLRIISSYRAPTLRVEADGRELEGPFCSAVVCNARNYGGVLCVTPDASMSDGRLDLCARRGRGRFAVLRHLACALFRWKDRSAAVYVSGTRFRIRADEEEPPMSEVQVDGDDRGCLPLTVEMSAHRVRLMVPA